MEKTLFEHLLPLHGDALEKEDLERCVQLISVFPFCEQHWNKRARRYNTLTRQIRRSFNYSKIWGIPVPNQGPFIRTVITNSTYQNHKSILQFHSIILDNTDSMRLRDNNNNNNNNNNKADFRWSIGIGRTISPLSSDDQMLFNVDLKGLDLDLLHVDYQHEGGQPLISTRFDPREESTSIIRSVLASQEIDLKFVGRPGMPVPFRTFEQALEWVFAHIKNKMELIS